MVCAKKTGLSKIFILYMFFLCLMGSIANFSNYNYAVLLSFCLFQICYLKNRLKFIITLEFVLMESSLFFMGLFFNTKIVYTIIDMITILFVISCLYLAYYSKISNRLAKSIIVLFSIVLILNILFAFVTDRYDVISGRRYLGLFNGANTTTSIICVMSAVIWELSQQYYTIKRLRNILFCLVVSYVFMLIMAQTRSALIFFPYWIYHAFNFFPKKYVILATSFLIACFVWTNMDQTLVDTLRLEEDGSFNTRASFYEMMIDGIINNHFIIPHGSYASYHLIRQVTGDVGMSPHNDILRYSYDWGIVFYIFLVVIICCVKKLFVVNKSVVLLSIGVCSGCLHNILFSPYIWVLYIMFLSIYSKKNYVSNSKEV